MMKRRRGRIVIVSSLAGAMPGVSTAAMYAATKCSLGRELEGYGVGCWSYLCHARGSAVTDTNFQSDANMMDSTIFKFPIGGLTPEIVAESAVRAEISGRQEVFVGWMNVIMGRLMSTLLPARLQMLICELTWRPLPFRQLFSERKTKKKMQ
jgi:short-subunit dehydrogenase